MRTVALLGLTAQMGCSGIQIGDSDGSEDGPCIVREVPLTDLSQVPPGLSESPEVALASADGNYRGTLTLPNGDVVPLDVLFDLDEQSALAVYWDAPSGKSVGCSAPSIRSKLSVTVDAGTTLSGVAECEVSTLRGPPSIATVASQMSNFTTTLMPSFSGNPLYPPSPITHMTHYDGTWTGDWTWRAFTDCANQTMCLGVEEAPLGNVTLSRMEGP